MKRKIEIMGRKVSVVAVVIALLLISTASAAIIQHYAVMEGNVMINSPITISVDGTEIDLGEPHILVIDDISTPCTITKTLEFNNIHGSPVDVSIFWILYESSQTFPDLDASTSYWVYDNVQTHSVQEGISTYEVILEIPSYMIGEHKFRIEVNPVF